MSNVFRYKPVAASRRHILPLALLMTTTALLAGCDDEPDKTAVTTPPPVAVTVSFAAKSGGAVFDCEHTATGLGSAADVTLTMNDFRLYVSNLRLLNGAGVAVPVTLDSNDWQLQAGDNSVALLDFVNKEDSCAGAARSTRTIVTGTVPAGTYTGVEFEVGVPAVLNHSNAATAPSPLNLLAMNWEWQYGRKFLKVETSGGMSGTQTLHLGSTGCTGDGGTPEVYSCTNPYRPTIRFDDFDAATDTVVADIKALYAETDLNASESMPVMAMSMPMGIMCMPGATATCQLIVAKVGADTSGNSTGSHPFFRVE
jgi:uncharacterized repeat protein (TIGR04052 family)